MAIKTVLEQIRTTSESEREKGDRFERLILAFLRTDPSWASQFERVWLWNDWPDRDGPDVGIDLVAKNSADEGYTAIQCKFYSEETQLNKEDIDSFFTESGKAPFTHRIIACTTNLWSTHAQKALVGQAKPVRRISLEDLDESSIDWERWNVGSLETLQRRPRKTQRPHQTEALEATRAGFKENDRGKLIMACGTGKTYTGQRIAEELVGPGGNVLVLLPSISLLSQTLKEWTADASIPVVPFAVCSDAKAGRRGDSEDASPYDLVLPATTDPDLLVAQFRRTRADDRMSVIFSTYQSIEVITAAQSGGVPEFDLLIADEAHRTTGVTLSGADDSNFVKVHDDVHVKARKRLYMTATPRVFSDTSKAKATAADAWVASMDDPDTFGPEFHRLGFHEAVNRDLLTDYKVLVLAVDEEAIATAFQRQLSDDNHELQLDDATRIVGCLNALAKRDPLGTTFVGDEAPMRRAVAFSNTIAYSKKFKGLFSEIANRYENVSHQENPLAVSVDHVDGKFNALQRESLLRWLKDDPGEHACNVLSNAKCLTEGVDVPALDAIMFLQPRNSMVDVIQAVGRVMRKAPDKKFGYVILPVGIPADETPETALSNNERFKAVWQVLNALRSHDERLTAVINQLDLNDKPPDVIDIVPVGVGDLENDESNDDPAEKQRQLEINFPIDQLREALYAKLVAKVGTRTYWETWANDIAAIASRHETRIRALVRDPKLELGEEFERFVAGLQRTINSSITPDDAIAMLSQHLITKPVFNTLFDDYDFTEHNPVSQAMQRMLAQLAEHSLTDETEGLEGFYESVKLRVEGIDNAAGKQRIITELYEGFFSKAFPKASASLGIVYTPIELVDFTLYAADHALRRHFAGTSLTDDGVNVLDPFCGTGTFLVRLLQSGIIKPGDLPRKFRGELHSNEILLLAYYIAAINIETTYRDVGPGDSYEPFDGIVLTDTFQLGETGGGTGAFEVFPINNARAEIQREHEIRVIIGNPPYSVGQSNQNDDNQNLKYENLDARIAETYVARSSAVGKRNLYDSYVRAFRWASDRLNAENAGGVIAYVTNGGFIDSNSFDGFRKTLSREFHHIYIYNLRGNARGSGQARQAEAGNVFESGSRATVAVTILVREPGEVPESGGQIHYRDVGDYLTRDEKLSLLNGAANQNALDNIQWEHLTPNEAGDWTNQRSDDFQKLVALHDADDPEAIFEVTSQGLLTSRDAWNFGSSREKVRELGERQVDFFNQQAADFEAEHPGGREKPAARAARVKAWVDRDPRRFSWERGDFRRLASGQRYEIAEDDFRTALYRPFFKQFVNFADVLNPYRSQLPRVFPTADSQNLVIVVLHQTAPLDFAVVMSDQLSEYQIFGYPSPVFPRFVFDEPVGESQGALFSGTATGKRHNVTDWALEKFQQIAGSQVTKDDVFFYVYGVLHAPDYRDKFAVDLKRAAPRVPQPSSSDGFWSFSSAGRELAELHIDYEAVEPWPHLSVLHSKAWNPSDPNRFRVEKLRYAKNGRESDRTQIIYNSGITISGIPNEAHDYVLGSRSALDWLVDRYQVKTHKDSQIVNDPNDWADEHRDPQYIFDLIGRVVTVSMRTLEITRGLPPIELGEPTQ